MVGNGLYLKQGGGQIISGEGLPLVPNSPLKNIPVLGWLLWDADFHFLFH